MGKPISETFQRIYKLYASDLSITEIERLVKRDAPGIYDYYLREAQKVDQQKNPVERTIRLVGNLFEAFLRKLSPSRRLFYSLILFLFIYSVVGASWFWAIGSFVLLNVLLAFELADKLIAKDELEVARDIQMNLMPQQPPAHPNFEISSYCEAAREVGGDYFDFIHPKSEKGVSYVMVGDVSGKGMAAALHMVQVQALLHSLIEQYDSPKAVLQALNKQVKPIFNSRCFFTINLAKLTNDNSLRFCRAGHMPLLIYRAATDDCETITPNGLGIGLHNGKFDECLSEVEVATQPGDVLCFFTDGIVETMNAQKVEFGEQRFQEALCANAHKSAKEIQTAILSELAHFRGAASANDDLTLVIMKAR